LFHCMRRPFRIHLSRVMFSVRPSSKLTLWYTLWTGTSRLLRDPWSIHGMVNQGKPW
jgi:hypothetical protein